MASNGSGFQSQVINSNFNNDDFINDKWTAKIKNNNYKKERRESNW